MKLDNNLGRNFDSYTIAHNISARDFMLLWPVILALDMEDSKVHELLAGTVDKNYSPSFVRELLIEGRSVNDIVRHIGSYMLMDYRERNAFFPVNPFPASLKNER